MILRFREGSITKSLQESRTIISVVIGLRAFRRHGRRATFGIWVGRGVGGGGEGGNYVRNTRITCNLQCFLVAQILTKKPRLRSPLERMRVFFASIRPNVLVFAVFRGCRI